MPPKKEKSKIQALQKDLQKKKTAIAQPRNAQEMKKAMSEDKAVRTFFAELANVPDASVVAAIQRFSDDSKGAWSRSNFFKKFINNLPPQYYKQFAQSYIDQDKLNLEKFWDMYIAQPEVAVAIRRIADEPDKTEEEKEADWLKEVEERRLGKAYQRMLEARPLKPVKPVEELEQISMPEVQQAKQTNVVELKELEKPVKTVIDVKPEREGDKGHKKEIIEVNKIIRTVPAAGPRPVRTIFKPVEDLECINQYTSLLWVDAKVSRVYIAKVAGTDITPYIAKGGEQLNRDGTVWYQAGREFTSLMCNNFAGARTQEKDVLTAFTRKGTPVRFKVAYATNRGFIVQDEELFAAEQAFLQERKQSREEQIERILNGPVDDEAKQYAYYELSTALHKVAPNIADYGVYTINGNQYDTLYIKAVINTILSKSHSVREFATNLGNLIVHLEPIPGGPNIFIHRIKMEYYLPEILANLSRQDKLPEYYDDPSYPADKLNQVSLNIDARIRKFVTQFGKMMYQSKHTTTREPTRATIGVGIVPKAEQWKSICVNYKDVEDLPDAEVVYYKHRDTVYCMWIPAIAHELKEGKTPTMPGTNIPLSNTFIKKFRSMYDLDLRARKYDPSLVEVKAVADKAETRPKTPEQVKILAPGLLDLIRKNIGECEDEIKDGIVTDDGKCPTMLDDDNDEYSPGFVDDETTDEEDGDTTTDEGEDTTTDEETTTDGDTTNDGDTADEEEKPEPKVKPVKVKATTTPNTNMLTNNGIYSPKSASVSEKCSNCGTDVDVKKTLKTKVDGPNGFETVHFCGFECFENHESWPKSSKKVKSGKK
jgi:hypothetical protein